MLINFLAETGAEDTIFKAEAQPVFSSFNSNSEELERIFNDSASESSTSEMHPFSANQNHQDHSHQLDHQRDLQNVDMNEFLNSGSEDSADDCILIEEDFMPIPLPLPSTTAGLVKYQADPISGDTPYMNTVISTT